MFSSCFCIFNEGIFGIFGSEGDLLGLWFSIGGYLLISYSPFLPDFQEGTRFYLKSSSTFHINLPNI